MTNDAFEIEELGTYRYLSMHDAQRAAVPGLAQLVASMVRDGIEDGRFAIVNGVVRLADRSEFDAIANPRFTNGENDV